MKFRFAVKGMTCASCTAHVERAVRHVVGSSADVFVSLLTESLTVITKTDPQNAAALENALSAAVRSAGYELLPPSEISLPERERKTLRTQQIKLLLSALFTAELMYFSMGASLPLPFPNALRAPSAALTLGLLQLALTVPVLLLNLKFFKSGFSALFHLAPNMDSLVATGASASLLFGILTLAGILEISQNTYFFESSAMILTLVSLGKHLETRAKTKASDAIRSLSEKAPKHACVLRDGKEVFIPTAELQVGDILLVKSGEWIPADGTVTEGSGSADLSALTGESMPVELSPGDSVKSACILLSGAIRVRAEQVGENTSFSAILRLLEDAAASKAPVSRLADKVSAVFVPAVMGASLLTGILWLIINQNPENALRAAISVLVISCPCALGLATPTAITVGLGRGAKLGILFRSAESLERLSQIKVLMFDKTGTVTEGKPSVTDRFFYSLPEQVVLASAAAVEKLSSHPLALAVENACREQAIPSVTEFESVSGMGAKGKIGNDIWFVGKPEKSLSGQAQIDLSRLLSEGKTAVAISKNGDTVGLLGIRDNLRKDSRLAVSTLQKAGVTCKMLTGDNENSASLVAKELSISACFAGLSPEQKLHYIKESSKEACTGMVGDGINDSPALAAADVGIAVGAGTDFAMQSADVVLSGSSLSSVCDAFFLSKATVKVVRENLFWALFYNAVCIPVAAVGLLNPMIAAGAMSLSSLFVVTNALRLRKIKLPVYQNENAEEKGVFAMNPNEITLSVGGMMCPKCVSHVKTALESVPGVICAEVSLEKQSATVKTDGTALEESLKNAVISAGYDVQ